MTDQSLPLARPRTLAAPVAIAAWAGVAAVAALRLAILFRYRIDSDETQHLHVAWGWTHGLVQYRDVFDNHMPLFHLLSAPLLLLFGERPEALIGGRLAMLPLFALIVLLTYRLAASCHEARAAAWAAAVGALVPVFFLCSVELRPDVLWAACWMTSLLLLVGQSAVCSRQSAGDPPPTDGSAFLLPTANCRLPTASGAPVTPFRSAAAGLFLGLAAAVSAKTSLLAVSLAIAALVTFVVTRQRLRLSCVISFVAAALVPPLVIAAGFAAMGAWDAFVTGTITHNLVASEHPHRVAFIVPSTAIIAWVARRIIREDVPAEVRRRRLLLFLAAAIYGALLISFWPIIEREHWLPFYPAFAATAVPHFLGRRPRLAMAVIAVELLRIVAVARPWTGQTGPSMAAIARTLQLTTPHERVVDLKGELLFRRRATYAVFEKITKKAISSGRQPDTIAADVLRTHAMVAVPDDASFPRRGRAFLLRNFIDVGPVRVAGMIVPPSNAFRIELPGEYSVVSSTGTFHGSLDGSPYAGPRSLGAGMHTLVPASPAASNAVIWSRAAARGWMPSWSAAAQNGG